MYIYILMHIYIYTCIIYEQVAPYATYAKVLDLFCFVQSLYHILYIITNLLTLPLTRSHSQEMPTVAETAMLSIATIFRVHRCHI